jgi:hypothetical protein
VPLVGGHEILLLDLPGHAWPEIATTLPDGLFDRIGRYL